MEKAEVRTDYPKVSPGVIEEKNSTNLLLPNPQMLRRP